MREAALLFTQYANDDDFYTYVRANVRSLEGGNETDVEAAIEGTRKCFDRADSVPVVWGTYMPGSNAIGGWHLGKIKQNSRIGMSAVERAGHWVHELTHKCGYSHIHNNITLYPIIRKSWPYQLGYKFEDYVTMKQSQRMIAGE
jgi:hypothetical protein